jgi:hypothetical protein
MLLADKQARQFSRQHGLRRKLSEPGIAGRNSAASLDRRLSRCSNHPHATSQDCKKNLERKNARRYAMTWGQERRFELSGTAAILPSIKSHYGALSSAAASHEVPRTALTAKW